MTLNDLLASRSVIDNDAADVSLELWQGERPIEIRENADSDWHEKPIILTIDGAVIRLTAAQADAIGQSIGHLLQEYGERINVERLKKVAEEIGNNPLGDA